jgi:hypothetical protein
MPRTEVLDENKVNAINALLIGRKVTKVADDQLLLDNGVRLRLVGNNGGCSCGAGDYKLTELNGLDNIVTAAVVVADPVSTWDDGNSTYRIYVYAENEKINLATFVGDDGNGYYGTGFEIHVTWPED